MSWICWMCVLLTIIFLVNTLRAMFVQNAYKKLDYGTIKGNITMSYGKLSEAECSQK